MYRMYGSRTPTVGALGDAGAIVEDKSGFSAVNQPKSDRLLASNHFMDQVGELFYAWVYFIRRDRRVTKAEEILRWFRLHKTNITGLD